MAILRANEIRKLEVKETDKRMNELRLELSKERGNIHIGGTVTSPGRIKEIRRTIARILTIKSEKSRASIKQPESKPVASQKPVLTEVKGGKK